MQRVLEAEVEIDRRMVERGLPARMFLYALDADHFALTGAPSEALGERALTVLEMRVSERDGKYVLHMPRKVFAFYRLAENEYTVMVSSQNPLNVIVSVSRSSNASVEGPNFPIFRLFVLLRRRLAQIAFGGAVVRTKTIRFERC